MNKAWLAYGSLILFSALVGLMLAGGPGALGSSEQPDRFPPFTVPATIDETSGEIANTVQPEQPNSISRSELSVAVANATGTAGRAGEIVATLVALGYDNAVPVDADAFGPTVVFYSDGSRAAARDMATELGLSPDAILETSLLPPVETDGDFDLVVMLGTDSA